MTCSDSLASIGPFKVLLLGSASVGKTCIFKRFFHDKFDANGESTVGIDFGKRTVSTGRAGGREEQVLVKLLIWDTAGQERFRALTRNYYRGVDAVLLVYDVTDIASFQELPIWLEELNKGSGYSWKTGLVLGCKCDAPTEARQVSLEEGDRFAREHRLQHEQVSAKTGENVDQVLFVLARAFQEMICKNNHGQEKRAKQDKRLTPRKKYGATLKIASLSTSSSTTKERRRRKCCNVS